MSNVPTDRVAAFKKAMGQVQKSGSTALRFGAMRDVIPENDIVFIPTSFPAVDYGVMTHGGLPMGRLVELYGSPSAGKTLLALRTMAEAQRMGYLCAFIDAEQGFGDNVGRRWMEANGVDTEILGYSNQNIAEFAIKEAVEFIQGGFQMIVIDSIGGLVPAQDAIENMKAKTGLKAYEEFATKRVASLARAITGPVTQLMAYASQHDALVVAINQVRDNIGGMVWAGTKNTPGGKALEHAVSVRLQVERVKTLMDKDIPFGAEVNVKCRKSKVCPPFRQTGKLYPNPIIYFDGSADNPIGALMGIAVNLGVIEQPTSRSYLYTTQAGETITQVGKDNMVNILQERRLGPELNQVIKMKAADNVSLHGNNDVNVDAALLQESTYDSQRSTVTEDLGDFETMEDLDDPTMGD